MKSADLKGYHTIKIHIYIYIRLPFHYDLRGDHAIQIHITLIYLLRKEGYVFGSVCLYVFLSVC